jgi:hypothetical protein
LVETQHCTASPGALQAIKGADRALMFGFWGDPLTGGHYGCAVYSIPWVLKRRTMALIWSVSRFPEVTLRQVDMWLPSLRWSYCSLTTNRMVPFSHQGVIGTPRLRVRFLSGLMRRFHFLIIFIEIPRAFRLEGNAQNKIWATTINISAMWFNLRRFRGRC